jgi:hypothetical protein
MQALTSSNSNESGRILALDRTLRANPSLNQVASERIGKAATGKNDLADTEIHLAGSARVRRWEVSRKK